MTDYLVTGGAGFIGSQAAHRWLSAGHRVTVFDNMSRLGSAENLAWLRAHPQAANLHITEADVRQAESLAAAVHQADVILHAAGQTAVTRSVADPRADFEANALGALNLLEAARTSPKNPVVLYTSTNKVYGGLEGVRITREGQRYAYADHPAGISEAHPLDFHSPYGCSKGAADQYTRDYARIYGLRTVVFRQSCIYGPWQFGTEDQGWLAHFAIAAANGHGLTIYGDGMQARDALYIDDLVDAFDAAVTHIDRAAGQVYNIGGGPGNTLSLLELIAMLEELSGQPIPTTFSDWRPGDQRVFVSSIEKARDQLGWVPRTGLLKGVSSLFEWVRQQQPMIARVRARL